MTDKKLNTLLYSHNFGSEETFVKELDGLGYDVKYFVSSGSESALGPLTETMTVQNIYDLRRGVFPEEVSSLRKQFPIVIDQKVLKHFEPHLFNILSMCSRMDGTGFSFSQEQRWDLFKELIYNWYAILKGKEIELVVFPHVPHFPSEYILDCLCKQLSIPVMMKTEISGTMDVYYATSVMEKHLPIQRMAKEISDNDFGEENIDYFKRLQSSYEEAEPWDLKAQREDRKLYKNIGHVFKVIAEKLPRLLKKMFKNTRLTIKVNRLSLRNEKSGLNYLQFLFYVFRASRIIKRNQKIYNKSVKKPNFQEKYVLFASHYQPERTTSPDAGYFYDLHLIIDMIARNLPEGWKLYYKEHPSTFMKPNARVFFRGHMFRSEEFFEKLLQHSNVQFIDAHEDNFKLIDHSQAVTSATGTSVWEAVIRGKVGIIFGNSWFEGCEEVASVRNEEELKAVLERIQENKEPQIDNLIRYREAFLKLAEHCPLETQGQYNDEERGIEMARFVHASFIKLKDLNLIENCSIQLSQVVKEQRQTMST